MNLCYGVFCKFWGDFGYVWENFFFLKGFVKFRDKRNIDDLMSFSFKIINLQPGVLLRGYNCLLMFQKSFFSTPSLDLLKFHSNSGVLPP